MKKIRTFLSLGLYLVLVLIIIVGCSSLGVATSGAEYFNGKKETDLVKYFKYDGEPIKADGHYDKVLRFSNLVTTVYVDKTTTEKFKKRRYYSVSDFSFKKLPDGCLLADNDEHFADVIWSGQPIYKVIEEDVPSGGTPIGEAVNAYAVSFKGKSIRLHRNNNTEIKEKIKSFNSAIQQYKAVKKTEDESVFNVTPVGSEYYVYDIESNSIDYSDNKYDTDNSTILHYTYELKKVSIYEDSKSTTETHTAYIYNDRKNAYTDEKGNLISEADAFSNEKSYIANGFKSRKKDKGVALVAYIKDGIVVKVESAK